MKRRANTTSSFAVVGFGSIGRLTDFYRSSWQGTDVQDTAWHILEEALGGQKPQWQYSPAMVFIPSYVPKASIANPWLSAVTTRIQNATLPEGSTELPGTEWLNRASARAAFRFFENGADLLPSEPHIYGTRKGDLVAEFKGDKGVLTAVVTDEKTTLYAVLDNSPEDPIHETIRKGSNQFRDELRAVTNQLVAGAHGQVESHK